jgi:hypothetical protein
MDDGHNDDDGHDDGDGHGDDQLKLGKEEREK